MSRRPAGAAERLCDEGGGILVMTAVSLVALMGITALSIDAAYMYEKRQRLYAAADAAAKSAALEVRRGNTSSLTAFAQHELTAHGFSVSPIVNCPPASGPFAGTACTFQTGFVEVIVSETTSTFFGKVLGWNSANPGARAVAGVTADPNCLVTVGNPGSLGTAGTYLTVRDQDIDAHNCSIADNGNLCRSGGADVKFDSPYAVNVSGACRSGSSCSSSASCPSGVSSNLPPTADPLEGLWVQSALTQPPAGSVTGGTTTTSGGCTNFSASTGSWTASPGCYNYITLNTIGTAFPTVIFNQGIYYIKGSGTSGLTLNAPSSSSESYHGPKIIASSGVMFYMAGGRVNIGSKTDVTLTGLKLTGSSDPNAPYRGIVFFQPSTNTTTTDAQFACDARYRIDGVFYFRKSDVLWNASAFGSDACSGGDDEEEGGGDFGSPNQCFALVSKSLSSRIGLDFYNTCSTFNVTGSTLLKGSPLRSASVAE